MSELTEYLRRIPLFAEIDEERLESERLGGLTNLVYRLRMDNKDYLLRVPGKGTEAYIDRKVELHNARVAAEAGVSANILFADDSDGLLLTEYFSGCTTMSAEQFRARPGSPGRAALAFKHLHTSGRAFEFRFELFAMIDEYLGVLKDLGAELPQGYHVVVEEAQVVREALAGHETPLAPCHCDPLAENFLDDGLRMWIVDWEYSGMNDPLWDLGDLSVEANFTDAQDREMMQAYCDGHVSDAVYGRMIIYKAMCDLLWTLWGLIQHANRNPADDFWQYAVDRFQRCKELMASEVFDAHVQAVRKG